MIRRKLSSGVLRASKSSGSLRSTALAHAHAPPVSQSRMQTAGLASATLLSSQRNWGKETVVTIKNELKKRGLSQTGSKAVLVDRIKSAEVSAILPPMPSASTSTKASQSFSRQLSTSASVSAGKKRSRSNSQPAEPTVEETSTDAPVTSTGPEVVSQRTEAPKKEEITAEEVSIAPGLPETKATDLPKKGSFAVEFPTPEAAEEIEQIIPVEPDNFRAKATQEAEPTQSDSPKVVTVASASTHIGGGPTHAIHESTDAHSLEVAEEDTSVDLSGLSSAFSSVLGAPGRALESVGITSALSSAHGFEKAQKEYKASDKPLNSEEKTGVWIFGGIVGLGLLLGGGKKKEKKSHVAEAAGKVVGGTKGDAKWEKASGAGIVGHGGRKN